MMRKSYRASCWRLSTGHLLSITTAVAIGTTGCSKSSERTTLLPSLSKASKQADDQKRAQEREEALAGSSSKPKSSDGSKLSPDKKIASTPKKGQGEEPTSARPGTKVASLERATGSRPEPPETNSLSRKSPASRSSQVNDESSEGPGTASLNAPELPASFEREGQVASRRRDSDTSDSDIAGASWAGSSKRQKVEPTAGEQLVPGKPAKSPLGNFPPSGDLSSSSDEEGTVRLDASDRVTRTTTKNPTTSLLPKSSDAEIASSQTERDATTSSNDGRFQAERLMSSARTLHERGELYAAYRTALLAERVAVRENIEFETPEESPTALVRRIRGDIEKSEVTPENDAASPSTETPERRNPFERQSAKPVSSSSRQTAVMASADKDFASPRSEATRELDAAAERFATWRSSAPETVVPSTTPSRPSFPVNQTIAASGRKTAPTGTPEATSPSPRAWPPKETLSMTSQQDSLQADPNSAPVVLSSAISSDDESRRIPDVRGVVNAVAEQQASAFPILPSAREPLSASSSSQLLVPNLSNSDVNGQPVLFAPNPPSDHALNQHSQEVAMVSSGEALDDVELLLPGETAKSGLPNHFWTITGIVIAGASVLSGLLRRSRGRKSET